MAQNVAQSENIEGLTEYNYRIEGELYQKRWQGAESNRRHRDFQSPALPSELPCHIYALRIQRLVRE